MPSLSPQALQIINNYLTLPFPNKHISCPYFNNRRIKLRGGLRVVVGKGTPQDIVEETNILSLREKINLNNLTDVELKKFLIDYHLGIDCSGLVYHILDTEMKAQNKGSLQKVLKRPWFKNPLRKLLVKLRPIENTGVGTFNHEVNSTEINLKDARPGDFIILMGAGIKQDYNHILLIHETEHHQDNLKPENYKLKAISYIHSFQYPTDGQYNHGVRQENIEITDINKPLLEQNWSEPQMKDYAKTAKEMKIKRLKI